MTKEPAIMNGWLQSGSSPPQPVEAHPWKKSTLFPQTVSPSLSFEPLLDDAQAAEFLGGLHPKTVQRMARRGEIPHYRVGKYYRYRASELDEWLRLQSQSQNPSASTRKEFIQ
jgi:excisionase family DNA binding protein